LTEDGTTRPEVVLPLIVIAGVVALLATLAIAAAMFGLFGITDQKQALGLPAGSVQAVIALGLILIFAVVALYASSASVTKSFTSTGLTQEEFDSFPPSEILSFERTGTGATATYAVTRKIEDGAAQDINLQLLTTVSTLVVAVSAFYFGSKSVQEGSEALSTAKPLANRLVKVVEPTSPYIWNGGGEPLIIMVHSEPPDARLRASADNDDELRLGEISQGFFTYRPSDLAKEQGAVTLRFEQVDDPGAADSLLINFPSGGGEGAKAKAQPPGEAPKEASPESVADAEAGAQADEEQGDEGSPAIKSAHEVAVERQEILRARFSGRRLRIKP
jgi:hypothetical protein